MFDNDKTFTKSKKSKKEIRIIIDYLISSKDISIEFSKNIISIKDNTQHRTMVIQVIKKCGYVLSNDGQSGYIRCNIKDRKIYQDIKKKCLNKIKETNISNSQKIWEICTKDYSLLRKINMENILKN